MHKMWTDNEIKLCKKYILNTPLGKYKHEDLAKILNRSKEAVSIMANKKGFMKERKEKYKNFRYCNTCKKMLPINNFNIHLSKANQRFCIPCYEKYLKKDYDKRKNFRIERWSNLELRNHDYKIHADYRKRNMSKILWIGARKRAANLNLDFDLTQEDVVVPEKCPLLGTPLIFNTGFKTRDPSPSLDRIDPNKGYVKNNVWVISYRANRIKNDASFEELERITKNYKRKVLSLRNDTKKDIYKLDVPEPSIGNDEKTIIEIEECE